MNKTTMNDGSTLKETYCMGFRFTETDERRMACAKNSSKALYEELRQRA